MVPYNNEFPEFPGTLHCVKCVLIRSYSCLYFPAFGLNMDRYSVSLRIQSECGKIRTRITPNTDTFHAVKLSKFGCWLIVVQSRKKIDGIKKRNQWKMERTKKLWLNLKLMQIICLSLIFSCYYQSLSSGRKTEH